LATTAQQPALAPAAPQPEHAVPSAAMTRRFRIAPASFRFTLFFKTAAPSEVARRFHSGVFVTQVGCRLSKPVFAAVRQRIMQERWEITTMTVPVPSRLPLSEPRLRVTGASVHAV